MKKSLYLIGMVVGALICSGCLDENPHDQLTEEQAFDNENNLLINTVAKLYNYIGGNSDSQGLQGTARGVYDLQTFASDEAMLPTRGGDWYDGGLWQSLYLHTWNVGCSASNDTWKYLYKVIVQCNESLEQLYKHKDMLSADRYKMVDAEVRALRTMYYIYLLDLYGRVPYITFVGLDFSNAVQLERSKLFYNLYYELIDCLPNLHADRSNVKGDCYGRITQPVVFFLLAKMALNAEVWTDDNWTDDQRPDGKYIYLDEGRNAWEDCIYWCDKLKDYGYVLETDYESNFYVHNSNSKENIFTIPMQKHMYTSLFINNYRSIHYNHAAVLGWAAENGTAATASTVKTYGYGTDDIDYRFHINYYADQVYVNDKAVTLDNGAPLVYEPLVVEIDLTGSPYEKTGGARMAKYQLDPEAFLDGQLVDNDIVLFRYADALLMKAEAKVRNGEDGSDELNAVRSRAHMGSRPATLDNILDERLMELAWEGWRRQDLIRFDRFHKGYDLRPQQPGEADRHTIVFPIPSAVVNLNPSNRQNPGY